MGKTRTDAEQQIAELLRTAKKSLHLSVAFLSRLDGTTQHLEVVESSVPFLFKEGATQKQETTFCQAILDGKLPAVIPDVKKYPVAMALPAARLPRIRSYVSVPVVLSDGTMYGTFCAAGLTSDKGLSKRDKALMDVLAAHDARLLDVEQVVVHGRLLLGVAIEGDGSARPVEAALRAAAGPLGVEVALTPLDDSEPPAEVERHHVVLLASTLRPAAVAAVTRRLTACGANIDRVLRLSSRPAESYAYWTRSST